jgi:hypothetical protein
MNLQNATFLPVGLPHNILLTLQIVGVDENLLKDAELDCDMGRKILSHLQDNIFQGDLSEWIHVGHLSDNESYFCEIENKWEYVYRDDSLFVRKAELEAAKENWRRQESVSLRHSPFQMLATLI